MSNAWQQFLFVYFLLTFPVLLRQMMVKWLEHKFKEKL